ncbi:hypothetical protein E2C01_037369 [Portunus trituberculatus]|uniref:Uncharacterized protein n=1 Tax=Portunus trituberculatus TaxID=210409 RepID=A0A5B7FFF8_PORTR|nr:hypothetical protein [Portunus trituberculatus]
MLAPPLMCWPASVAACAGAAAPRGWWSGTKEAQQGCCSHRVEVFRGGWKGGTVGMGGIAIMVGCGVLLFLLLLLILQGWADYCRADREGSGHPRNCQGENSLKSKARAARKTAADYSKEDSQENKMMIVTAEREQLIRIYAKAAPTPHALLLLILPHWEPHSQRFHCLILTISGVPMICVISEPWLMTRDKPKSTSFTPASGESPIITRFWGCRGKKWVW